MADLRDVVFRCDASPEIGAGHVTRCSALATALRERGIESTFVLGSGSVSGFSCVELPEAFGSLSQQDIEATAQTATDVGAASVVVDLFGAQTPYLASLSMLGLHVGVIDDRADRDLRAARWLLNQNIGAQALDYRVAANCDLALGLDYAMLRPMFAAARMQASRRTFRPRNRRVLITIGGGNIRAESATIIASFDSIRRRVELRAIGDAEGRSSQHLVELLGPVGDVPEHMLWADVAVTAAGSTCWELMCLGVPMIVVPLDEGQRRNALCIAELGAGVAVETLEEAGEAAARLLDAPRRRAEMSRAAMDLVDGRGAERAAASLVASVQGARRAVG